MTDKAYIVANEQQEREVLDKLERIGLTWIDSRNPTERMPSISPFVEFPYVLFKRNNVTWGYVGNLEDEEIVFDGRKEEQMSEKYVVSQEFMNTLNKWREDLPSFSMSKKFVGPSAIQELDDNIEEWWNTTDLSDEENNKRLIAILRWVNGEDVFKVEKPKKWVVRSKATDNDGDYRYVSMFDSFFGITYTDSGKDKLENATHFDTKEEAKSWANAHQEVVQVEVDE